MPKLRQIETLLNYDWLMHLTKWDKKWDKHEANWNIGPRWLDKSCCFNFFKKCLVSNFEKNAHSAFFVKFLWNSCLIHRQLHLLLTLKMYRVENKEKNAVSAWKMLTQEFLENVDSALLLECLFKRKGILSSRHLCYHLTLLNEQFWTTSNCWMCMFDQILG